MAVDERLRQARNISIAPSFSTRDSVSASDRNDLRRFRVNSRSSVKIDLSGIKRGANVDVELFSLRSGALNRIGNVNFNQLSRRQRNQFITPIASSRRSGNNPESLTATLDPGTEYYLRVQYRSGRGRVNYTLTGAPIAGGGTPGGGGGTPGGGGSSNPGGGGPDIGGNSPLTATPITVDFNPRFLDDAVGDSDVNDYYSFSTTDPTNFNLTLTDLTGNANVEVLDLGGNRVPGGFSENPGTQNETINVDPLPAGDYLIRVFQVAPGQNTTYRLSYSAVPGDRAGNTPEAARDINADLNAESVNINTPFVFAQEFIGGADNFDYYRFDVPAGASEFFSATVRPSSGSLNANLFVADPSGAVDLNRPIAEAVARFRPPSTDPNTLNVDDGFGGTLLGPGTYYLRIAPTDAAQGTRYDLIMYTQPSNGNPTIARDIFLGENSSSPKQLTVVGTNRLFFVANDGTGDALWQADGRNANLGSLGSVKKVDVGGLNLSGIGSLVAGKSNNGEDALYFTASTGQGDALWRTNGQGAEQVFPFEVTNLPAGKPVNVNGTLYFVTTQSREGRTAFQLYRSDGTASGTAEVGSFDLINSLTAIDNTLYFSGVSTSANSIGNELWRITDPTAAPVAINVVGTDSQGNDLGSSPRNFFKPNISNSNTIYFVATGTGGFEQLWQLNGSQATVVPSSSAPAARLIQDSTLSPFDSTPDFTVYNNELYFSAEGVQGAGNNPTRIGKELWKVGTNGQISLVANLKPEGTPDFSSNVDRLTVVPNRSTNTNLLYFTADNATNGQELWVYDGTNPPRPYDLNPGTSGSDPDLLTVVNESLFFKAVTNNNAGTELWKIAPGGADPAEYDILPGPDSSNPSQLTSLFNRLFFAANNGTAVIRGNGEELWVIDG